MDYKIKIFLKIGFPPNVFKFPRYKLVLNRNSWFLDHFFMLPGNLSQYFSFFRE